MLPESLPSGEWRMEEPSPHEIRNTVVAALVGLLGGLGAGIATMAGPQAFPGAPLWLWQCLFWIGIVTFFGAAAYLFYEYRVRPRRAGKPKLDPLLIFALVATLVLAGSLFMMMLRGAQVQASIGASPQAESKQRPVFLRDLTVYADSAAEHSVWLTGTATATKKNLQVLVEYSLTFGNRPQNWEPMQRVHIGSLPDLVKGVSVQFPLAVRSNVDGQQRFFWGDPKII